MAESEMIQVNDPELNTLINALNTLIERQQLIAGVVAKLDPEQVERGISGVRKLMDRLIGVRDERRTHAL